MSLACLLWLVIGAAPPVAGNYDAVTHEPANQPNRGQFSVIPTADAINRLPWEAVVVPRSWAGARGG